MVTLLERYDVKSQSGEPAKSLLQSTSYTSSCDDSLQYGVTCMISFE